MTPTKKAPAPAPAKAKSTIKKAKPKAAAPTITKARRADTGGYPHQVGAPPPENQ